MVGKRLIESTADLPDQYDPTPTPLAAAHFGRNQEGLKYDLIDSICASGTDVPLFSFDIHRLPSSVFCLSASCSQDFTISTFSIFGFWSFPLLD